MNAFIPSQTALVLGGGGAKGAYQLGAIAALNELGIRPLSVYGTSVGALNAAMYAQGRMSEAQELWENLRLEDLVTKESLTLADDAEKLFGQKEKLLEFISRFAQEKGADITPFSQLLDKYVNEETLRRSAVRFGLVTTRLPALSMVEKQLEDMEAGSLHKWLLASSAYFPVFPIVQLGDDRYIDGGFCDNVPVEMAVRSGARHIIAIDIGKNLSHTQYAMRPNITYIRTSHPLGGLMTFDPALSARNRTLGYNDTLRAFGKLRGTLYAFDPIDAQSLYTRAQDFVVHLTQHEAGLQSSHALTRRTESMVLFALLEERLHVGSDCIDYFLRACELCGEIAGLNPARVYTFAEFTQELRAALPLKKAESMLSSLLGGRIGVLFAPPQPDRKLLIACLYQLLQRENVFSSLAMHTLSAFPREMLCALTLKEIL